MKPQILIALAGLLISMQGATLAYVVRIEHRITRLETIEEYRRAQPSFPRPPAPVLNSRSIYSTEVL